jgi:hypothetical protein
VAILLADVSGLARQSHWSHSPLISLVDSLAAGGPSSTCPACKHTGVYPSRNINTGVYGIIRRNQQIPAQLAWMNQSTSKEQKDFIIRLIVWVAHDQNRVWFNKLRYQKHANFGQSRLNLTAFYEKKFSLQSEFLFYRRAPLLKKKERTMNGPDPQFNNPVAGELKLAKQI